jgi:F0F1-type ATP synthase delta subunit
MMPEKLQILKDQYESAIIKMAKADAQIDCLKEQERSIQSLLDQTRRQIDRCFDTRSYAIADQREIRQAIHKEKGEPMKQHN